MPNIVVNGGTVTNADPANSTVVNNGLNNVTLNSGTLTSTASNITPNDIEGTVRPNDYYGAWGINGTLTSTGTSQITTTDASVGAGRVLLRSTGTRGSGHDLCGDAAPSPSESSSKVAMATPVA